MRHSADSTGAQTGRGNPLKAATRRPISRRDLLYRAAIAGGSALVVGVAARGRPVAAGSLPDAITAVMRKPRYANATWNLMTMDVQTGAVPYQLQPDQLAFTGSVRKLFSVGLALNQLGPDHRFTTPVYRRGEVDAQGVLQGDLILVGAGDLTLGGRVTADGSIAFTDFDHNDANNLGTAILTPQDPLHGLDELARQVLASGISAVTGDVVIDDRLFQSFRVPNQNLLITPIMVNENMVDVTVAPTEPGQAASVQWRPITAAFSVDGGVTTVAAGGGDTVSLSGDGRVQCIGTAGCSGSLSGDIPVGFRAPLSGNPTLVQTFRIEDPAAFARTAFIQALQRAGVAVQAPLLGLNPVGQLPAQSSYPPDTQVAAFVSPPYSEYARLILKVSLNLGANLSLMLFGLGRGQQTITGALDVERQALTGELGIAANAFNFPTNGSGSPDSQATARAVVQLLAAMSASYVGQTFKEDLPILGVNGSLASTGRSLPARGHVFAKTGTTVLDGALKAQNLGGYIDTQSGRKLAFALFVNDAGPLERLSDISDVFDDQAAITNVLYEMG